MVTDLSYFLWRCPKRISDSFEDDSVAPGETLQKFAEPVEYVYLLQKGEAKGFLQRPDGTIKEVLAYSGNELTGYLSYFGGAKLNLEIRAASFCKLKRIHRDVFLRWMAADHLFMQYVNATICKRYIAIKGALEDEPGMHRDLRTRCFLYQKIIEGENTFTKRELARAIGVDRDTIDHIVGELSTEGLIQNCRCEITIPDVQRVIAQARTLHERMIHEEGLVLTAQ